MRRLNLPALSMLLLAACATDDVPRDACWSAVPPDDAPLTATEAESLGDRLARRSLRVDPPTHAVELDACRRAALEPVDQRPLDDPEQAERKLEPLIKK